MPIVGVCSSADEELPINVHKLLVESGIARKVFNAFLKLWPEEKNPEYSPIKGLRCNSCRFGIRYCIGEAFEEEPSNYIIEIHYQSEDHGMAISGLAVFKPSELRNKKYYMELLLEEFQLIDGLIRQDIILRILAAVEKHIVKPRESLIEELALRPISKI